MSAGICDCCEREREVTIYADEWDCFAFCAECDAALRESWDRLTPEQQAEARAEARGERPINFGDAHRRMLLYNRRVERALRRSLRNQPPRRKDAPSTAETGSP